MRSDIFEMYYTEPRSPSETDLRLIEDAGHIAEIAIEGERSQAAPTRAFDELAKSEAELRTAVDSIPQLMVVIGADGNLLYANQAILEYSGLTKEEVGSERFREIFHPDDSERLRGERDAAISRGVPFEYERRLRRRDGQYRWFLAQYKPLLDDRGKVIRWYATGTDVDDRKRAEEKLRRSERSLLEAQRLGKTGSWNLNIASGTVTATPELPRLVGFKPGEDYSKEDCYFSRMHPDDRKRLQELSERCLIEKIDYETDYRMLLHDGTIKYIHSVG
jgi:PAS domain S-box-containing protein